MSSKYIPAVNAWSCRRVCTIMLTIALLDTKVLVSSWMPGRKEWNHRQNYGAALLPKQGEPYTGRMRRKREQWPRRATSSADSKRSSRSSTAARNQLKDWAQSVGIRISPNIVLKSSGTNDDGLDKSDCGLGWFVEDSAVSSSIGGQVVLTVPSSVALTVDFKNSQSNESTNSVLPWYAEMALQICQLDIAGRGSPEYGPWIQSLPRQFDTPIHWTESSLQNLQYPFLQAAVERQRVEWKQLYDRYIRGASSSDRRISYEHFVWGCECARSRAFAGSYSGSAFSPAIYAFTLLLVTIYVGVGLGTLEQAANGAGVVFAATILKDFVIPKFFKTKRYVVCPLIDMANHDSVRAKGEVAFEYFGNAYSLAICSNVASLQPNEQLYISYGPRNNDQLLQYYGFCEISNPNDVYIMPSIRDWDINALEVACGRQFVSGRLQILDSAGLLGGSRVVYSSDDDDDSFLDINAAGGGVVLNQNIGLDPAVLQALRVLVSTETEWNEAGRSIGNFSQERTPENERCVRLAAKCAIQMELASKPTTVEDDEILLNRMNMMKNLGADTSSEKLAIQFRIEKKKVLKEVIDQLSM